MARGLGNIVDEIYEIRSQRLALEDEVKKLKERQTELEQEFLNKAQEEHVTSARGHLASSSVTEEVVPNVIDWDQLYKFIHTTNYFHLLQRRPSAGAYKELLDQGVEVPGVEPYTKYKINTQKVS